MEYPITTEGKYQFVETKGQGETIILLHGLFGTLDNFQYLLKDFGNTHNVIAPIMPVFELPLRHVSVDGLVDFMVGFVAFKKLQKLTLVLLCRTIGSFRLFVHLLSFVNWLKMV